MAGDNNNFKLKSAEWQAYLRAKLEDLKGDMTEVKKDIKSLNRRVTNIQLKVAGIGAVASILMTLLLFFIKELLAK